jgi:hypothetical protein
MLHFESEIYPIEVYAEIFKYLNIYDILFLHRTSTQLYQLLENSELLQFLSSKYNLQANPKTFENFPKLYHKNM